LNFSVAGKSATIKPLNTSNRSHRSSILLLSAIFCCLRRYKHVSPHASFDRSDPTQTTHITPQINQTSSTMAKQPAHFKAYPLDSRKKLLPIPGSAAKISQYRLQAGDWRVSKPTAAKPQQKKKRAGKKTTTSIKAIKTPADLLKSSDDSVCLHCTSLSLTFSEAHRSPNILTHTQAAASAKTPPAAARPACAPSASSTSPTPSQISAVPAARPGMALSRALVAAYPKAHTSGSTSANCTRSEHETIPCIVSTCPTCARSMQQRRKIGAGSSIRRVSRMCGVLQTLWAGGMLCCLRR